MKYFVKFNDFDGTVSGYKRNKCKFRIKGSIITLGMQGGTINPRMVI
jgi:hypothetical protein